MDYAEAFDCVDHKNLWTILKEMGIPGHFTCLLRNLYAGQEATVRTTDWFKIGTGIRQGCISSPYLTYMQNKKYESHSIVSDSLWPHWLNIPLNSPGQNTGMGSCSLLQGIFPTQVSRPGLPHCKRTVYQLSHQGSPMCRVHHAKFWAWWNTSWNQNCQEKYQQPQICRWYNSNGRRQTGTKEPLDEGERGKWKSWLEAQYSKNKDHGIQFHHFMANRRGKNGNSDRLYFLGSKITVDGDWKHVIKRC